MKIFLATAMQHQTGPEFETISHLKKLLDAKYGTDAAFLAAAAFPTPDTYLPPAEGYRFVADKLRKSDIMVLYYPERVVSGCLIELGLALAMHIPVIAFVRNIEVLPYMVRQSLPGYNMISGIGSGDPPESDGGWMFDVIEAKYGEW